MNRQSPRRHATRRTTVFLTLGAAAALLTVPSVFGQTDGASRSKATLLPIKNDRFAAGGTAEQPVADWTFESITVDLDRDAVAWHVNVDSEGDAAASIPGDGRGVVLHTTTDFARGDLISAPIHIRPFRWVKVGVEYAVESGDPLVFICLRPTKDRSLVDLEFLPKTTPGEKRKAFVMLHSGALDGDYSVSVSISGIGSARVLVLKAREQDNYPRPAKPALVVDLMHDQPMTDGAHTWHGVKKLVDVYGFPSIEYVSYTQLTREKLDAVDPALVLLSAYVDRSQNPDHRKIIQATQTVMRYDVPLLGIALGHQVIARAQNATQMDRVPEFGPTRLEVVADDPVFAGLPRHPYFFATESHNNIVRDVPPGAEVIATSERVLTQAFRYPGKRCYTFQANIESAWEYTCPEACIVWKNVLRQWKLVPPLRK